MPAISKSFFRIYDTELRIDNGFASYFYSRCMIGKLCDQYFAFVQLFRVVKPSVFAPGKPDYRDALLLRLDDKVVSVADAPLGSSRLISMLLIHEGIPPQHNIAQTFPVLKSRLIEHVLKEKAVNKMPTDFINTEDM